MNYINSKFQKAKNACKAFINSASGVGLIVLFVMSVIATYVTWTVWPDNEFIHNTIVSIDASILSIIITITFVEYLFNIQRERVAKREEAASILRRHRVMQLYISDYIKYYHCISIPLSVKSDNNHIQPFMPSSFSVHDLRDMYFSPLYVTDSFSTPAIQKFFAVEQDLCNYIITTISAIDFKYYPQVLDIFTSFINASFDCDVEDFILAAPKISMGDKTEDKFAFEIISSYKGDVVADVYSGKLRSNIVIPYVLLYTAMNTERDLINKYLELIHDLDKSNT